MSIASIHDSGLSLFQKLIPKTCQITTQATSGNYANKSFIIPKISAGGIEERMKNADFTYSQEAVKITILFTVLADVMDRTNTIKAPLFGYKNYNSLVFYKGKQYVVKDEVRNEFDTTISLYCDTIG